MALLRLACALGFVVLAGCVPGELVLAVQGEGGADSAEDAGGEAPDVEDACPTPADCSNPACKARGFVCTPPPPAGGWKLAAVDFTSHAACPAGYGESYDVFTPPTAMGPAECGCACAPGAAPSCVVGVIDFAVGNACDMPNAFTSNDGACTITSVSLSAAVEVTGTPGATGGTCDGTPTTKLPPTGSKSHAVCPVKGAAPTTGCKGGDVCLAATSAQSRCVLHDGSEPACPGAYSVHHAVGADIKDTRECTGSCMCGAPTATCTKESWVFYKGSTCTGASVSINLDGKCDPSASGGNYQSYEYAATPTGTACGPATAVPTPSGGVALEDPETICCLPP